MAWDGLDLGNVNRVLGSVHLAEEQDLPAWAETLKAVLQTTTLVSLQTLEKGILAEIVV